MNQQEEAQFRRVLLQAVAEAKKLGYQKRSQVYLNSFVKSFDFARDEREHAALGEP